MRWRTPPEGAESWIIKRLFNVGRPQEVALSSDMSALELIANLSDRAATRGQLVRQSFSFGLAPRIVVGHVSQHQVTLMALRPGVRNAWRPKFRGRVVPTDSGSVLSGLIGWSRMVFGFSLAWMSFIGILALIGLITALTGVFTAHSSWALHGAAFFGGCLGIFGLGFLLFLVAGAAGRRDEEYLREWLTQATTESAPADPR